MASSLHVQIRADRVSDAEEWSSIRALYERIASIGSKPEDSTGTRARNRALTLSAAVAALVVAPWPVFYFAIGIPQAAVIPLFYVVMTAIGAVHFSRTHTVSPNGVFVRSSEPPALGSEVELKLELGNPPQTLHVGGTVVRCDEGSEAGSPAGFAVRFTKMTAADRAVLAELLDRVHETGL